MLSFHRTEQNALIYFPTCFPVWPNQEKLFQMCCTDITPCPLSNSLSLSLSLLYALPPMFSSLPYSFLGKDSTGLFQGKYRAVTGTDPPGEAWISHKHSICVP